MDIDREFREKSLAALAALFERDPENEELAMRLLDELLARQDGSEAARRLCGRLLQVPGMREFIGDAEIPEALESEPSSAPSTARPLELLVADVAQMRPPGTEGLPLPKSKARSQSWKLPVDSDAGRAARYRVALEEYIAELRANQKNAVYYTLRSGLRTSRPGRAKVRYQFEIANTSQIQEGEQVELIVDQRRHPAVVMTKASTEIVLEIAQDLGEEPARAQLRVDNTKLLELLRDRIRSIENGERLSARDGSNAGQQFNEALANAVMGWSAPPTTPVIAHGAAPGVLNDYQKSAWAHVLANPISYIWGPPGCGKTRTLGEVVRTTFEAQKRALLCSNTNKAVDQVLLSICRALGSEHEGLKKGWIVRLGAIADPKLEEEFGKLIDLDRIVAELARPLTERHCWIQAEISRVEKELAAVKDILLRFTFIDRLNADLAVAMDAWDELTQEHERMIRERRRSRLPTFDEAVEEHQARVDEAHETWDEIRENLQDWVKEMSGHDRARCEQQRQSLAEQKAALIEEKTAIENELAGLRGRVLSEARVVGATGTRAYLAPAGLGLLDLVIIDEASMLMQPMLWVVAGLAKERVVLCGDFRQLPPIVDSERQELHELLGRDVFSVNGLDSPGCSDPRMVMLEAQFRMEHLICALVADRMYGGRLQTTRDPQWLAERLALPRPPAPFDGPLTLIDTSALRPQQTFENRSRYNALHAVLVRNLAYHLTKCGFASSAAELAVITPYRPHAQLVRDLMEEEGLDRVQVGTVYTFQGDERSAMILDLPDGIGADIGRPLKGVGPEDQYSRMINVAVTRAKRHLIVLANLAHLDARLPSSAMLRGVLWDMQRTGRVISAVELLALGPPGRDLEGLEDLPSLLPGGLESRFGVFDSDSFDAAFARDLARAQECVAIFSGFVSHHRVRKLLPVLERRAKPIRLRCVSRPPHFNFRRAPQSGKRAFNALEHAGSVVDARSRIHQKAVVIDGRIVWIGSLNVLSFTGLTDEIMLRVVSPEVARRVARSLSKGPGSPEKALEDIALPENPRCGVCSGRTFFLEHGEFAYFACEAACNWRLFVSGSIEALVSKRVAVLCGEAARLHPLYGQPCPVKGCGAETWLNVNRRDQTYFYGCSRYFSHGCRGSVSVPQEARSHSRRE